MMLSWSIEVDMKMCNYGELTPKIQSSIEDEELNP